MVVLLDEMFTYSAALAFSSVRPVSITIGGNGRWRMHN